MSTTHYSLYAKVVDVNTDLGVIFGWAMVCTKDGEDYYDLQGDHFPEEVMMKGAIDFMGNSRAAFDMHKKDGKLPGSILFSFPLTKQSASAFDIETKFTGMMIGMKPESFEVVQKFKSGEYTGFSIGGKYIRKEESKNE